MIFIKVMLVKIESVLICLWWEGKKCCYFYLYYNNKGKLIVNLIIKFGYWFVFVKFCYFLYLIYCFL